MRWARGEEGGGEGGRRGRRWRTYGLRLDKKGNGEGGSKDEAKEYEKRKSGRTSRKVGRKENGPIPSENQTHEYL